MFPYPRSRIVPVLACMAVILLSGLAGCGGDQEDPLLAVVGEVEIRGSAFEERLVLLEENELPKDENGQAMDMALLEAKSEFLTTLINKELMVAKAIQLGYGDEPRIAAAHKSMLTYEAALALGQDVINAPAGEITNEELDAFYERLGERRRCKYIVTNFESEARAARDLALGGADWDDVADRFHLGDMPTTGLLEVTIPWGRFDLRFEKEVFAVEEGGISEPIETEYGWWVVRVEEITQGDKPDKEGSLAEILDLVHRRKMMGLQKASRLEVREKYKVEFNDDALDIIWSALPAEELMVDPLTDKPVPQDELQDLDVVEADLDVKFYSYEPEGETRSFTVGDFKSRYDNMNTFQRPKREQMVPGLKGNILQVVERHLMDLEAREKGYYERADVLAKVQKKFEGIMVTSLYSEVVTIDEHVSDPDFDAYWAENSDYYLTPEMRSGRLIIGADEAEAAAARLEIVDGKLWREVVQHYGTDNANKSRSGKLDEITEWAKGSVAEVLFSLAEGEMSQPFPVEDDRYAIVRCERILPGKPADKEASREGVVNAVRARRKEALFQSLLAEWAVEFGVIRYDENLTHVKSWLELTHSEAPGDPVARN